MEHELSMVEKPSFVKKKHELQSLYKAIELGSEDAVKLLIATMNAPEDKVSMKTKLECADRILELQIKIAAEISRDQLTRQIAEVKAVALARGAVPEGGKRPVAVMNFGTLQEVK